MPDPLQRIVEVHMARRGLTENDHADFLFVGAGGDHLEYSNWLHRIWYPARLEARLEGLQFHDLRRANATGLVLEGVDLKTAQTRLGHTDPRLTLAIYAQATTEADRAAADRLGERFFNNATRRGLDLSR
jgi:integrase